jgi:uncharacterized RDD family membrane protein YckC
LIVILFPWLLSIVCVDSVRFSGCGADHIMRASWERGPCSRRDAGALSTSLHTAVLFPEWKQEVNRRVAAHLRSKTYPAGEIAAPTENRHARGSRAAQAAARVAARYANAPSYSEMLTREARAAVHAAEAASKAAQQAQAAFQYVLDGLEAATSAEPEWEPEPISKRHAGPVAVAPPQKLAERPQVHHEAAIAPGWELETDTEQDETASYRALPRYDRPSITEAHLAEPGEFAQPIYANLIQFPREMIATRRVRPRRAEGPLAEAGSAPQLSIFEVDPAAISTEPAPATMDPPASPEWMHTEWSDMTLQPLPPSMSLELQLPSGDFGAQRRVPLVDEFPGEFPDVFPNEILDEAAPRPAPEIAPAPFSRRLLAAFVDGTLIAAALVVAATLIASNASELPGVRTMEFGAAVALLAIGVAYYACFMTLARATPGMRYAGIELNTFSGYTTSRGQRCGRLLALLLSVLPLGLGVVWALFDDGRLTWHDRLSHTYLRKR